MPEWCFGGRMKENVERCGAEVIMVEDEWGKPVDPNKVEEALQAHPDAKLLAFVHAETSTGARSDAQTLSALAHKYDCLSLVDSVTGLAGVELDVDGWKSMLFIPVRRNVSPVLQGFHR